MNEMYTSRMGPSTSGEESDGKMSIAPPTVSSGGWSIISRAVRTARLSPGSSGDGRGVSPSSGLMGAASTHASSASRARGATLIGRRRGGDVRSESLIGRRRRFIRQA